MGPNNLCYVARHFLFFSLCRHVTFYKSLTSLSTVFIKAYVRLLQPLKWPCRTLFFTHVEPYKWDQTLSDFKLLEVINLLDVVK